MKNEFWKNRNIVITGGTSGLGKNLALELVARGANVAVIARNKQGIAAIKDLVPNIVTLQGDVASKESVYPLAGEIHSRLGSVDFLFNNASYLGVTPLRLLVDTECEDFEAVLQTNLLGPFRLIKALIPNMILKNFGRIVNVSSDAAVSAYSGWGAYGASKASLDHMTRIFNEELRGTDVRFFAIDPGDMNTPMHLAAIPDADVSNLRDPRESAQRLLAFLERNDGAQERLRV
ncbi:MAG: SDR family NAD(P)-dependent oxidoreductase [Oligoflexales bacterium]